jgi:hypothetical protein
VNALLARLTPPPTRRELVIVLAAIVAGVALRLAYVAATRHHALAGDEIEYDLEARLGAAGHFLWSSTPYNIVHASTWKSPAYPAFLTVLYKLLGSGTDKVIAAQVILLTPFLIGLTWLAGRRLFTPAVGVLAALVVAVYPNAWQFDVRLYSEALANPLTTALLLVVLTTAVLSWRRALTVGVLLGVLLLVRSSSVLLVAGIALLWWWRGGARDGTLKLAATLAVAALVVAPWSIRNATLDGPWVPVSVQSAAGYGVFNDDAAHDAAHRWAWRPLPTRDVQLFKAPRSDGAFYKELNKRTFDYIGDHPSSVPKAFWHNGVLRLWDLRKPSEALFEVPFEGRTRAVTAVGFYMYWVLAALALAGLVGLWRRGRRDLVLTLAAIALAASVVYTTDAGTRYRAPFEPLIVVLAMSVVAPYIARRERLSRLLGTS